MRWRQHGFELPPHSFKVTTQLDIEGTARKARAVHVVPYKGHSKPAVDRVFDANEKPKTEGADRERCHPGGNGMAAQATEEPGGYRCHKPDANDQNCVVSHV